MPDHRKSKNLKILSGLGSVAIGGLPLQTSYATTASSAKRSAAAISISPKDARTDSVIPHSFKIQIITGRSAQEDTVIFINTTTIDC